VKLSRKASGGCSWELDPREASLFLRLLRSYPVVGSPPTLPGSGHTADSEGAEALLRQSFAQQSEESRQELRAWLEGAWPAKPTKKNVTLDLSEKRLEWLLHVFNDIRVGHWKKLGSPDHLDLPLKGWSLDQLGSWRDMQASGFFETAILTALNSN